MALVINRLALGGATHSRRCLMRIAPASLSRLTAQVQKRTGLYPVFALKNQQRMFSKQNTPDFKKASLVENPPFKTLDKLLDNAVAKYGENPALGTRTGRDFTWITYEQLNMKVSQMRGMMKANGLTRGDRVAIISNNRVEWAITAFACHSLGIALVPMYETQQLDDWQYIIGDSEPAMLLTSKESIFVQTQGPFLDTPKAKAVYCFDVNESNPYSFKTALSNVAPADMEKVEPNDTAMLIYTSGTTGRPKGVVLSHWNIVSNVLGITEMIGDMYGDEEVHLSFLPWAHAYGYTVELICGVSRGSKLAIASSTKHIVEELAMVHPTILVAVPQLFYTIHDAIKNKISESSTVSKGVFKQAMNIAKHRRKQIDDDGASLSTDMAYAMADKLVFQKIKLSFGGRLRMAMTGGASLPESIQEFFQDIGIPVLEGYGLTETSPVVVSERYGVTQKQQGGLLPIPGVKVLIRADNGDMLPVGQEGEICVQGPNVMQGYLNKPDATAEALVDYQGKPLFRTGDLGRITEEGNLLITGRVKEQYKLQNGKFVVPGHIERSITQSRFINQAVVYGRDKPYNVALIVPNYVAIGVELEVDVRPENLKDVEKLFNSHAEDVRKLIDDEVAYRQEKNNIKSYERVRDTIIVKDPFTVDNGLLTPKMSIKVNKVIDIYGKALDALYDRPKEA